VTEPIPEPLHDDTGGDVVEEIGPGEALDIIAAAIDALPEPMRSHLQAIPVGVYAEPPPEHLYLGARADHAGAYFAPVPNHLDDEEPISRGAIALYLDRIRPLTVNEVCRTYLHEAAHALGMDEETVEALGLARNNDP
jgi:predicted Zn-dependent protease with MMP-like domain